MRSIDLLVATSTAIRRRLSRNRSIIRAPNMLKEGGDPMKKLVVFFTLAVAVTVSWLFIDYQLAATQPPKFGLASINGTYIIMYSGTVLDNSVFPISGPIAAVGHFRADGKGNLSGSDTFDVDGLVCLSNFAGTYTVDASGGCTVSVTSTPVTNGCPSGKASLIGEVFSGGGKVVFVQNDTTKVLSGEADRQ